MENYNRLQPAALAMIISSTCWLIAQTAVLFFGNSDVDNQALFSLFIPVGLIFTGLIMFSKRVFSKEVAWSLFVLSVIWLPRDLLKILDLYLLLSLSFNLRLLLDLLVVIVPVSLWLTGFFIALKKSDRTIPACLLFVGAGIWIISSLLNVWHLVSDENGISDILMLILSIVTLAIPVSLIVFARALLSKEVMSKEPKTELFEPKTELFEPIIIEKRDVVVFVREDKDNNNIWMIYQAPAKADALEYLSKQEISVPSYYVVVETPEGNFGKDINGLYQE